MKNPKVLISYRWNPEENKIRVEQLVLGRAIFREVDLSARQSLC